MRTNSGAVEICYEVSGESSEPPVVLVAGLGAQLSYWPTEFIAMIEAAGLSVVRPDNRDVGLSTHFKAAGIPDLLGLWVNQPVEVPYTLDEMAADIVAVLDALLTERAHLVGFSLGGMIAQLVAISHPERVASLCSVMSTTGDRAVGYPSPQLVNFMIGLLNSGALERQASEEEAVATDSEWHRLLSSPGYPMDQEWVARRARADFERAFDPSGIARQLGAYLAGWDRTKALGELQMPTVVIHGSDDSLIDQSGGRATAAAIPGAKLVMIDGMGHDFPAGLWCPIADELLANIARAKAGPG